MMLIFFVAWMCGTSLAINCVDNATCYDSDIENSFCINSECVTINCSGQPRICSLHPHPDGCIMGGCGPDKICMYVTCAQLSQECGGVIGEDDRGCIDKPESPQDPVSEDSNDNTLGIVLLVVVGVILFLGLCMWVVASILPQSKRKGKATATK